MTSRSFFTLVLPSQWLLFRKCFHAGNIAIKQQQYCNTVRPQLSCDHFTHHMTSQTWWLKKHFLNDSFASNTRYEHFYNLKRLYSGYLSEILWYKRKLLCCQCPLRLFLILVNNPQLYHITIIFNVILHMKRHFLQKFCNKVIIILQNHVSLPQ